MCSTSCESAEECGTQGGSRYTALTSSAMSHCRESDELLKDGSFRSHHHHIPFPPPKRPGSAYISLVLQEQGQ